MRRFVVATGILLVSVSSALAQVRTVPRSPDPAYDQTIGLGVSWGPFLDKEAEFWGIAADWGKRLRDGWSGAASLAFDRETDRSEAERKITDTLSAVAIVSYTPSWWTLTTGLSKGFADDDHPGRAWKLTSGDWGTGLAFGVALPGVSRSAREIATLSVGWEYNLTESEANLSFDLGLGRAF